MNGGRVDAVPPTELDVGVNPGTPAKSNSLFFHNEASMFNLHLSFATAGQFTNHL